MNKLSDQPLIKQHPFLMSKNRMKYIKYHRYYLENNPHGLLKTGSILAILGSYKLLRPTFTKGVRFMKAPRVIMAAAIAAAALAFGGTNSASAAATSFSTGFQIQNLSN